MKTLATIFGALALMTWGASAQEGPVPATAADAQPALLLAQQREDREREKIAQKRDSRC